MSVIQMKDIAVRLLTPNDTLDVRIFDSHGKMYPDLRKALLAQAESVAKRSLLKTPELTIRDIYLNGSSASYFYHEKSDLDVRIEISHENCTFLTQNEILINQLLNALKLSAFPNSRFEVNGRFVDIKLNTKTFEIMGLYSLLQDKWIIEPRKDITRDLDLNDIMEEYTKRFYDTKNYMFGMLNSGKNKTMEGIEEIEKLYQDALENNNVSIREYVIYKLLNYRGIHSQLQELFNDSLRDILSLPDKPITKVPVNAENGSNASPKSSPDVNTDVSYTLPPLYEIKI